MSPGNNASPPPLVGLSRLALVIGGVILLALWRFAVLEPGENLDDAFILLIYAKHFVANGQIYYDIPSVHLDGFTSPLDLLIKSLCIFIFPKDPIFIIWIITIGIYLAVLLSIVVFALRATRHLRQGNGLALIVLIGALSATSQSLAAGSQFLLETPLYTLLGVWLVYPFLVESPPESRRDLLHFGLLLVALPLTRPEGLVVSGVSLVCFFMEQRRRLPLNRLALPALIFVLGVGIYYIWRVRYFGYWAPNTYYAKTSASRLNEIRDGFSYVGSYTLSFGLPVMIWMFFCPFLLSRFPTAELRRRYGALCLIMLASLAAVIYAGGDCYGGGRFLALPGMLAMLALLMALVHLPHLNRSRTVARYFLYGILGIQLVEIIAVPVYLAIAQPAELRRTLAKHWPLSAQSFACDAAISAQLLRLANAPGQSPWVVAHTDDQRLKYFADGVQSLDLTGLNDRAIAHRPVDAPVVWGKFSYGATLERRPEVWILGHQLEPHTAPAQPLAARPLHAVLADPDLAKSYFGYAIEQPFIAPISAAYVGASLPVCGGYFNFFLRRDLVARAQQQQVLIEFTAK